MNARIYTAATIVAVFCGVLPAKAADSRLLNLVMPDANVVAGVNVSQAKATPFGQYVLAQIAPQNPEIQKMVSLLGFDPRTDVQELLVSSHVAPPAAGAVAGAPQGLALAVGIFNIAKIAEAVKTGGGKSEIYGSATIFEDPAQKQAVAILDNQIAVFGDLASVKAAIDRKGAGASKLPAGMFGLIGRWSSQDAWVVANVPASLMKAPATASQLPGMAQQTVFQSVQNAAGGINFQVGGNVMLTIEANSDTAQNAASMAGALQLLANMARLQASQDAQAASLLKSLAVTAEANVLKITLSLPADQFQQLVTPKARPAAARARRAPAAR
jgi:hypothetical protein